MEILFWIAIGSLSLISLMVMSLVVTNARHFSKSNLAMLGEAYRPHLNTRALRGLIGTYAVTVLGLSLGLPILYWHLLN